jgi:hypothetical protein
LKITEATQIFWLQFSHGIKCNALSWQKRIGLHFGRFFSKLIWSPC